MMNLLRRNTAFIYFSFIVTGLTSVAPQQLFAVPDTGPAWAAGTLLIGTLASIAGVALADRFGLSRRPAVTGAVIIVAMTACLLGSFQVRLLTIAAALQITARFLANYIKQDFDRRAVIIAGVDDRVRNDRIAMLMRFTGMVLGPLWFGAFRLSSPAMLAAIFGMMLLSIVTVSGLEQLRRPEPTHTAHKTRARFEERLLAAVAIGIYGQYYLLASNIVYVLGSASFAGVLITTVYAAAMVATVFSIRWLRRPFGLGWMLLAPVLMFASALAVNSELQKIWMLAVAGSIALGFAFATYLLAIRNHVTRQVESGRTAWLGIFNNLGNTSALLGFSAMTAVVVLSRTFSLSYTGTLATGLCGLSLLNILGALVYAWRTTITHEDGIRLSESSS